MRHAGLDALERLEPLLRQLRAIPSLAEKRPGAFSRGSKAFLHFHEDPSGLYADVRVAEIFERHRVTTIRERAEFMQLVRSLPESSRAR